MLFRAGHSVLVSLASVACIASATIVASPTSTSTSTISTPVGSIVTTSTVSSLYSTGTRPRLHSTGTGYGVVCNISGPATVTVSSIPFPVTVTVVSFYPNGYINGDDGFLLPGATVTYTEPLTITTSVAETLTNTYTSTPTSKIGTDQTTTVPAPPGFSPVRDTLPDSVYRNDQGGPNPLNKRHAAPHNAKARRRAKNRPRQVCANATSIVTSTVVLPTSTTTVITSSGVQYITWPVESTGVPIQEYSLCTTVVTFTSTSTEYASTTTSTVTASTTTTVTPITTSLYAACETSNFANYKHNANDTYTPITFIQDYPVGITITSRQYNTTYDCCAYAVSQPNTRVWSWTPDGGGLGIPYCTIVSNETACNAQNDATAATYIGPLRTETIVVGNGFCGSLTGYFDTATAP